MLLADKLLMGAPGVIPQSIVGYSNSAFPAGATTSFSVIKPTGTIQGDLMLMFHEDGASGGDTITLAGWVPVFARSGSGSPTIMSRTATNSDPTTYTFAASNNTRHIAAIVSFRGVTQAAPVGVVATGSSTVVASSITPTVASILVAFYAQQANSVTASTPAGMSVIQSNIGSASQSGVYTFSQHVLAGATGTRTTTWSATANNGAGVLLCVN